MPFHLQFRQARKAAGLTQKQAAALLGYSHAAIQKWESGAITPRPIVQEMVLSKLAKHQTPKT